MDHNMGGMMTSPPPPSSMTDHNKTSTMQRHHTMMHMTFYWGENAEILFSGWPGYGSRAMYALSLLFVFLLAVVVEWLSHSRFIKHRRTTTNVVVVGVLRSVLHALRMSLAYLVMLAVMSFNGGIFMVAVLGHALGFLVFGTRVFGLGPKENGEDPDKGSELPPLSC